MKNLLLKGLVTGISILSISQQSTAQDGSVDVTFGTGGKNTLNIGTSHDFAKSIVRDADGNYVLAGYSSTGSSPDFSLVRFNHSGFLDYSFGTLGKVTTAPSTAQDYGEMVLVQPDGKILMAGTRSSEFDEFTLIRYNTNGTLDNSFGVNGIRTTDVSWSHDKAKAMILQPDGKILLGGYGYWGGLWKFVMVRYDENGTLDASFGTSGIVQLPTATATPVDMPFKMQLMSDGRIVLGGSQGADFMIVRTDADGNLDGSFDEDGILQFDISGSTDTLHFLQVQSDGKIIVGGNYLNGSDYDIIVARLDEDGRIDNSFGTAGIYTVGFGWGYDVVHDAVLQSDGKLVMVGSAENNSNMDDYLIMRLNSNGTPDVGFGILGFVIRDHDGSEDVATCVTLDTDEKIVVGGYAFMTTYENNYNFTIQRFLTDGSIDNTFGDEGLANGRSNVNIGTNIDNVYAVAQQSTGKTIVAGNSYTGSGYDISMVRFNADGSIDNLFGLGGKILKSLSTVTEQINAITILPDDKILIAGTANISGNNDFFLARYYSNGIQDNTFGTASLVNTNFGVSNQDYATCMAIQPDGKIVVAGYSLVGSNNDLALARYNANGTLDNTFGTNGRVLTPVGVGHDNIHAITLQPDGKIVVVGSISNGSNWDFGTMRYNSNGTLDNTFSGDGIVIANLSTSSDEAKSVAINYEGKIVVAGSTNSSGAKVAVLQYNSDGTLDTDFATAGKQIVGIGTGFGLPRMLIQGDRRILIGGFATVSGNMDFGVARLTKTGTLDNTFGSAGTTSIPIGAASDQFSTLMLQPDGKIIVVGMTNNGLNNDFAVARLVNTMLTLPLNWTSFTATRQQEQVQLKWETSEEKNTRDFDIEYSTNQRDWPLLSTIPSNANTSGLGKYVYTHSTPVAGANYYRIQQRDVDGKKSISETRMVHFAGKLPAITVMSNPVLAGQLQIRITGNDAAAKLVSIYQADGRMIYQEKLTNGTHSIDMSGFAAGTYLLKSGGQTERILVK